MEKIITYWNNSKTGSPKHRQGTKLYQETIKSLKKLKKGIFFHENELDLTRYKDFNQTQLTQILNKAWNEEEIKYLINILSKLYQGGQWPLNKKSLPKNLNGLLYNPITKYSWLVTALLRQSSQINITQTIDPLTEIILEIIPTKDINKLNQIILKITEKYEKLIQNRVFLSKFPTKTIWVKKYIEYLKTQDWIDAFSLTFFDPCRKTFQDFINEN